MAELRREQVRQQFPAREAIPDNGARPLPEAHRRRRVGCERHPGDPARGRLVRGAAAGRGRRRPSGGHGRPDAGRRRHGERWGHGRRRAVSRGGHGR